MTRRHLFGLLALSLVISCALAVDDKENTDESDKKDEKSVSKRGVLHYSTHGHVHPAVVSSTHYHLPPSFARYPVLHHHKPIVPHVHSHLGPVAPHVHSHLVPSVHAHHTPAVHAHLTPGVHAHLTPGVHAYLTPAVHSHLIPAAPAVHPHYHLVPGGASVTSYSVNYPRVPLLPRPVVPFHVHKHVPAFAAPVVPAVHPSLHHHHHTAYAPHYHPTFVAPKPIAFPVPGIRHPKYPVFVQPKPFYPGFHSHYVPFATPNPTFIPVAVPSHPQPAQPPTAIDAGTGPHTNFAPQIPMPTQPTFMHQPTMPTMTSHGWRPIMMMTQNHHPQTTQPTFTNKHPPYNYHAPSVAFNHDQASSTNDIVSGHGQMSGQLAQQLALYQQQQQYIQQQQHESRFTPTR